MRGYLCLEAYNDMTHERYGKAGCVCVCGGSVYCRNCSTAICDKNFEILATFSCILIRGFAN